MSSDAKTARAIRHVPWLDISVVFLVMSTVFYRFSETMADPDLWGHIKFGQDLWQTGNVIRSDTYSYLTGDQLWLNHEWLSEAIFYLVFAGAGSRGLIGLKVAVSLLIAGLVFRHLCRQGLTPLRAGIVVLAVTMLVLPGLVTVRPQMFTFLFFALVLLIIYYVERGRTRWLWVLPPLFALWANFHGGFLAGIGILVLWSFAHFTFALLHARRPGVLISPSTLVILLAVMASVLATFLNPYGMELLKFLLQTAAVARPEITEWQPLVIISKYGITYITILTIALAGLFYSRRNRNPALIALFACASLLPLMAYRHGSLFALVVAFVAGEHIGDAWDRLSSGRRSSGDVSEIGRPRPWLTGLSVSVGIVLAILALPHFDCIRLDPQSGARYPARAVALIKQSGVSGNLAIYFDWGEYALWHLSPRIKVSVDGRRETVFSPEIYLKNWQFYLGTGDWDALLREHETQMALVTKAHAVFNLMRLTPAWALVYEDPMSGLFVRNEWPLVNQIQGTDPPVIPYDGAGLCFP